MLVLNKKGFLLIDSLITVFVTSLVCAACFSIFNLIDNYEKGYLEYQERSNENLEYIFNNMWECEGCIVNESD